jgi:acylphosphatase
MEETQWKIRVRGRVQMVGYRWYAKQYADMLGIRGYVRNAARGEVEIVARAKEVDLNTFMDYLKQGPSRAQVDRVIKETCTAIDDFTEFSIKL